MFDFSTIQYNSENPTFTTILITVICSFILASLVAFTYEKTSRDVSKPTFFLQSLVLIAIVAAMVMQAIGDSLARGLGMLGALAIIRFRTTVRNPRNIVFMFASIAAGIACGVFGLVIAIVGTVTFCLVAFLLRFTPFSTANNMIGSLTFILSQNETTEQVEQILKSHCKRFVLKSYRINPSGKKKAGSKIYQYHVSLRGIDDGSSLVTDLKEIDTIEGISLEFKDTDSGI